MLDEKARDHQLALGAGENLLERLDDVDLGSGEALAIDVGAVGEERQHALGAELGEAVQVEVLAVDRRLVDLEVAGEEHHADRAGDGDGHAVGHAVRDADELEGERADGHRLARGHRRQTVAGVDAVLFELGLDERQGHGGAVHRAVEERHHVRHGADVILVAVGEHQRLHLITAGFEVGEVRNDQVHAELVGVREHHAGVDEDGRVLP